MTEEVKSKKTFHKAIASYGYLNPYNKLMGSPWSPEDVDKLEKADNEKEWSVLVKRCRYFYKKDPFVSAVLNRIVDISVNDLSVRDKSARKETVDKIVEAVKPAVLSFLRTAALEYLLSGLVVPEVEFTEVDKNELNELGIKRFESLMLPTAMWLRDPALIKIKDPMFGGKVSYFMKIPEEFIFFVMNEGKYPDGTKDVKLYQKLVEEYPELVIAIKRGEKEVLLDNSLIVRYRTVAGNPYPLPYISSSLESLEHKRNLRRMDYSIAARVITSIMLIRLGSDEFPLTEDNEDQLEALKQEMLWREGRTEKDVERVFQLFGNHTLQVDWIFPDVKALLDEAKYKNINNDIAVGLGFPRIMITGETEKSFTSDPDIATVSPLHAMTRIQESLQPIAAKIFNTLMEENNLGKGAVEVKFHPINMMSLQTFVAGIAALYMSGNLSREDYAGVFGFDIFEQFDKREVEEEIVKERKLNEFSPMPFSNQPGDQSQDKKSDNKSTPDKKKPSGGKQNA